MGRKRISEMEEHVGTPAAGDLFTMVDVSDLGMAPTGTNKFIRYDALVPPAAPSGPKVYSYNFVSSVSDRALWVPVGAFRKTYGNLVDEDGRTVLGCTLAQHSTPPTTFTTSNSTFATWNGPTLNVLEGDVIEFTALLRWVSTANSLSPAESDTATGYSQAYDRNGFSVRCYPSLRVDTNFIQNTAIEPSSRNFMGWLEDGTWHAMKGGALADSDGTLIPSINVGPLWANAAGQIFVSGAAIVVASRNQ